MTPQEYEALMRHVRNIGYPRFEAYHEEINAIEAWLAEKNKVMTLDSLHQSETEEPEIREWIPDSGVEQESNRDRIARLEKECAILRKKVAALTPEIAVATAYLCAEDAARKEIDALRYHLDGVRKQLRIECDAVDAQADNEWPDDLHLADALEKHLMRPIHHRIEELQKEITALRERLAAANAEIERLSIVLSETQGERDSSDMMLRESITDPLNEALMRADAAEASLKRQTSRADELADKIERSAQVMENLRYYGEKMMEERNAIKAENEKLTKENTELSQIINDRHKDLYDAWGVANHNSTLRMLAEKKLKDAEAALATVQDLSHPNCRMLIDERDALKTEIAKLRNEIKSYDEHLKIEHGFHMEAEARLAALTSDEVVHDAERAFIVALVQRGAQTFSMSEDAMRAALAAARDATGGVK